MQWILYMMLGLIAGIAGGCFGIGGGIIMVPALVYIFGLTQHQAQGTTLAIMIPPIGLLAAMKYYMNGNVKVNIAVYMCIGFFIGGYFGAQLVQHMPNDALKRAFGILLFVASLKMMFGK